MVSYLALMGIMSTGDGTATEISPFVRIVYVLEADVFLVLKETIKLRMVAVESKFC